MEVIVTASLCPVFLSRKKEHPLMIRGSFTIFPNSRAASSIGSNFRFKVYN